MQHITLPDLPSLNQRLPLTISSTQGIRLDLRTDTDDGDGFVVLRGQWFIDHAEEVNICKFNKSTGDLVSAQLMSAYITEFTEEGRKTYYMSNAYRYVLLAVDGKSLTIEKSSDFAAFVIRDFIDDYDAIPVNGSDDSCIISSIPDFDMEEL